MFGITTASAFFAKVQDDLVAFEQDVADPFKAINSILSAYHLHEWVWARWLKARCPSTLRGRLLRDKPGFVHWLAENSPHFDLLQQLANGSKHCLPVTCPTQRIEGYGVGPYGLGPYGHPYLLIEVDKGEGVAGSKYTTADTVLSEAIDFWRAFFDELQPT